MMRPFVLVALAAASSVLAGCQDKGEGILGKWGGKAANLEFRQDGSLIVDSKPDEDWTWERYGRNLILRRNREEFYCGVTPDLKYQLQLWKENPIGDANCPFAGSYWDLDPPQELPSSFASYLCRPTSRHFSKLLRYTPQYRIEADRDEGMVCLGRTDQGCDFVAIATVRDMWVSTWVRFTDGTAEQYEIENYSKEGLRLRQGSSSACDESSCMFGSYSVVGPCEKVTTAPSTEG